MEITHKFTPSGSTGQGCVVPFAGCRLARTSPREICHSEGDDEQFGSKHLEVIYTPAMSTDFGLICASDVIRAIAKLAATDVGLADAFAVLVLSRGSRPQ